VLSDHEQERLRARERQFRAEDPEFTRSFDTRARHLRRQHGDGVSLKIESWPRSCSARSCCWPGRPAVRWPSPPRSD
jgi:hypothetical protein